jgi:hypothetical protein
MVCPAANVHVSWELSMVKVEDCDVIAAVYFMEASLLDMSGHASRAPMLTKFSPLDHKRPASWPVGMAYRFRSISECPIWDRGAIYLGGRTNLSGETSITLT